MTTLTKDVLLTGNFGLPGDPGSPGTPDTSYVVCREVQEMNVTTVIDSNGNPQSIVTPGPRRTVCETRTIEGSDPVPPTPPEPEDIEAMYNLGWNAGGVSIGQLSADGTYSFKAPLEVTGVVTGFNDENGNSVSYENIDYGIYLMGGKAVIIENGVQVSAAFVRAAGDVWKIQRTGFTITYWQNNTLRYTSLVPSYGAIFADASMYRGGDLITDAALSNAATLGARTGGSDVSFLPLDGLTSNKAYCEVDVSFQKLTTQANLRLWQGSNSVLEPLGTFASNKPYADARVSFVPLTTTSGRDNTLTPSYALVSGAFAPLLGSGYMLTGGNSVASDPRFKPLDTFASDKPYAEADTSFEAMGTVTGYVGAFSYASCVFRNAFTMRADGHEIEPNAFRGTMSMSFSAYGGGYASMRMSRPSLLITGVGTVIGRADLIPESFSVVASGFGGATAASSMTLRGMSVRAFSGAVVSVTLQDGFTLEAEVASGNAGRVRVRMGLFELVASGTVNGLNGAEVSLAALASVPSAIALLVPQGFRLVAVGSAVVEMSVEAYEAYTLNLVDRKVKHPNEEVIHEVTRYDNYPFEQIVRFNGKYYGVALDGLYLLEGDDDNGDPIIWDAETCVTDFGTHNLKTAVSAYMSGIVAQGMTIKVTANQRDTYTYRYATPRDDSPQNHRQKFGKGLKATYYSFQFTDSQGRQFRLNNCEFEVGTMKRAI